MIRRKLGRGRGVGREHVEEKRGEEREKQKRKTGK